jgi:NitT/TauT family transport system ATP-binding protein
MLKIESLSFSYNEEKVINNLNLELNRGDIISVIGPSGSGKSTLLKILSGIIVDYSGNVLIDEKKLNPKIHNIGFIPQHYGLLSWKNVYENINLSQKIKNIKNDDSINKVCERLGIHELLDKFPNQISGGQKQRVAIARTFVIQPSLLLMDEPFSALDAINRESLQEIFLQAWKSEEFTTILVTHSVEEALYLSKKIYVLNSNGSLSEEIKNPFFGVRLNYFNKDYFEIFNRIKNCIKGDNHNDQN